MRRWSIAAAAIAGAVVVSCTTPHCNDRKAVVEPPRLNADFEETRMPGATREFVVYRTNTSGPPVLLLHEIPGLSDATFRLAKRIGQSGYTVYVPLLFGKPRDYNATRNLIAQCVFGRDFDCFRNPTSSGRIADELAALGKSIDAKHEGEGIGAVGMCLTGALPLELIGKGVRVKAAMLSQPTLPIFMKRELAVPANAITLANEQNVKFVGARFRRDGKSTAERMKRLDQKLTHFSTHDIPGYPKKAHAVLTAWFCDVEGHPTRAVLDDLLATFDKELKGNIR
jgi:dienelactone hydrolase